MLVLRLVIVAWLVSFAAGCAGTGGPLASVPIVCSFFGSPAAPPPPPPAPMAAPAPPPDNCGRIVLRGVNFAFDSAEIDGSSSVVLDAAADQLNECPNVAVRVEGNTDWIGTDAYNQGLSERRAESVMGHLIAAAGAVNAPGSILRLV